MRLGKDVFLALAAIVWADGKLTGTEVDALLAAAVASGISGPDLDSVRAALKSRTDLSAIASLSLPEEERAFVYGIASWLTRVDGSVTADETEALARLGELLGLSEEERALVAAASFSFPDLAGGASRHDIHALAREIERAAAEA